MRRLSKEKEAVSRLGYSDGSPFAGEPYLDINTPTGYIDMTHTGIPIMANGRLLPPYSGEHFMGETIVREVPYLQTGGDAIPTVPLRKGVRKNPDGSHSTHLMRTEYLPEKGWVAFPSLFQNEDNSWMDMSNLPPTDWMKVYDEALKRKEVIYFGADKEKAVSFGKGSWKTPEKKSGGEIISLTDSEIKAYQKLGYDVKIIDDDSEEMSHFEKKWDGFK